MRRSRLKSHRGLRRSLIAVLIGASLFVLYRTVAQWGGRAWVFVSAVAMVVLVALLGIKEPAAAYNIDDLD